MGVQSAYTIGEIDIAVGETLRQLSIQDKSANYTITPNDRMIRCTDTAITITLPPSANLYDNLYKRGKDLLIMKKTNKSGNILVQTQGGELIKGLGSNSETKTINDENDVLHIVSNGSGYDVI